MSGLRLSGTPTHYDLENDNNVTLRASDGILHIDQSFIINVEYGAINQNILDQIKNENTYDENTYYTYISTYGAIENWNFDSDPTNIVGYLE